MSTPRIVSGLAVFMLLALVRPVGHASAGIVNVQSILTTQADEGLSGSVTGAIDWRTGNHTRLLFRLAPMARYRTGDHLIIAMGSIDYYRDTKDLRFFEHVRYRYQISHRLLGEAFVQHERNDKRLLGLRMVAGFGPKYQLVDRTCLQVGAGVAYLLEYEELQDQEGFVLLPPSESPIANHRISSYLTGSYEIDDRLQLVQTVYVQPLITHVSDFRLLSESALAIKLSKSLSFKTAFNVAYDSEPPKYEDPNNANNPDVPTVKALDTALLSSLSYEF